MNPKIAIVGCGSIGTRHARNLKALGAPPTALVEPDAERLQAVGREVGAGNLFTSPQEMLKSGLKLDAAVVCTPTVSHIETAAALARAGLAILMEKPLGISAEGVEELAAAVGSKPFMMAMCYRYHPGLKLLREMISRGVNGRPLSALQWGGHHLPDWRPTRDYRAVYSAKSALGGGVLWDSIHSLDIARWLFGEIAEVSCVLARTGRLEIDSEDLAAMIFTHSSGAVTETHVDYLQRKRRQFVEVVCEEGNLLWDFDDLRVRRWVAAEKRWEDTAFSFEVNDMYLAEMCDFLDAVRGKTPSPIGLDEGIRTMRLALAAIESSKSRQATRPSTPRAPGELAR